MAGDWIKMRASLHTNPKVNGMARFLESSIEASEALSTGFVGHMSEVVTRNVMRNVVIGGLLQVWSAANEHTDDGEFKNTDLSDIDDIAGIPSFAVALMSVGWLIFDEDCNKVILPNFTEYNTCGVDRAKENNRERQRRYREKMKQKAEEKDNGESNVTHNVTCNDREEKRREENYIGDKSPKREVFKKPTPEEIQEYCDERGNGLDGQVIFDHYETSNWFRGKTKIKDWRACVRTWEKNKQENKRDMIL